MSPRTLTFFLALSLVGAARAEFLVARATVFTQAGATAAEIHAAQELREYLIRITGARIPMSDKAPRGIAIIVGQGSEASKLFPKVKWNGMGPEQTLVKLKGNTLLVAGGRPRGTLYAVYRLLSQKCGVRWWAPWATSVPRNPALSLPEMDWSETPAFEYRDAYWYHAFDGDWAAHNFNNGINDRLDDARGGKVEYQGFVHTYYGLVNPNLLVAHPDWFSLINNKRTTENAQLCTTNPQLRDYVVEQVKAQLRANPKATIISVSQNDCFNPCQCPVCRALSEREASDAALVLDLANYVGEKIEKEFPKVSVDTLAYQWSRHPTKTMKPRPNVIVRLCSIECNFAYPLDSPQNAAFGDDIRGWSKLTNRLYVWDYCTDFAHYLQPHPDYFTLGPTIKFFANNGVKGVFEEGAYQSNDGDMAELKAWVTSQLLWEPRQDPNKLIDEFLKGYYGPAAREVKAYLELLATEAKAWNLTFASSDQASFLRYDVMRPARELLSSARSKVAADPNVAFRVDQILASVDYVWLRRWEEFRGEAAKKKDPWPLSPSRIQAGADWLKIITTSPYPSWTPVTHVSESGLSPQDFVKALG